MCGHSVTRASTNERAGLPAGSTSNWFRTRRALLAGIIDWMAEQERADFAPSLLERPTPETITEALCAVLLLQTGPLAARTRARYALFLELAADDELLAPMRRQRREFEQWTDRLVAEAGHRASSARARGDSLSLRR